MSHLYLDYNTNYQKNLYKSADVPIIRIITNPIAIIRFSYKNTPCPFMENAFLSLLLINEMRHVL